MNIALFSDMHGNCVALDAVLAELEHRSVDQMVCLGDTVQGGSQPRETIDRLRNLGCPVILGNSDYFVLTGEPGEGAAEPVSDAHLAVRDWTVEQLGDDGLAFIRAMSPTYEIALEDGSALLCFHGSPRSFNEVLLPESTDEELDAAFTGTTAGFLAGGHTHLQWLRTVGPRMFAGVGSAGLAYNRHADPATFAFHPFAQYAVVHSTPTQTYVEFCQVPFDVGALADAARKSGRPYWENEAGRY